MFCEIWGKIRENISFLYIYELGVQIFMELWYLTLLLYSGCVAPSVGELTWLLGDCVFFYMRSFSKIDFPDSLTVGLSSNFDI